MPEPAFKHVEELFHRAIALDPGERSAFLNEACAGDAALRATVDELLKHDEERAPTDESLISPVARQAEQYRGETPTILDEGRNPVRRAAPALPAIPGYELLEELGRGGMGVVYKARQLRLNRIVALKMLLPHGPVSPDLLTRFRTEAEALARLHHPNIVSIYDVAECDGHPYFTMEYVAGPSLSRTLAGRPQDIPGTARLLEVLARAIHAVHQCGIIHRDLKPGNVLLQIADCGLRIPDNRSAIRNPQSAIPKITDFGLAKDQTTDRDLTQSGTVMGTPCYMAPEQARPTEGGVGPAADIYALGSILYEMLTGRPPFDADSAAETVALLLHDEPLSPIRLRRKLPRDLVTICLKALEKAPQRRYASALDLAEDLRRFQAGEPIRARPVSLGERAYRWCRRRPLVAALVALSSLLAVAFAITVGIYDWRLREALLKKTEEQGQEIQREEQQIQREEQQIVELNITIGATALDAGDTFTAVLRFTEALRLDRDPAHELSHRTRIATALRQCPELIELRILSRPILCTAGERVVTVGADHTVEVWDVQTGRSLVAGLKHSERARAGALSSDGHFLGVIRGNGVVRVWDLRTKEAHELPASGEAVDHVAFHRDGGTMLAHHTNGTFRLWSLKTWTTIPLESIPGQAAMFSALSDDGRWLFTLDASHQGQVWDLSAAKPVGKPLRLPGDVSQIVFSPDGERGAAAAGDRSVRVWNVRTGEPLAAIARRERGILEMQFSPDGRLLLTRGAGGARVWNAATGEALTPALGHGGPLAAAGFSGDGRQVITASTSGTVCCWELPRSADARVGPVEPDRRPIEQLVALAQVQAGGCIDENQRHQPLDAARWRATWEKLRTRPADAK